MACCHPVTAHIAQKACEQNGPQYGADLVDWLFVTKPACIACQASTACVQVCLQDIIEALLLNHKQYLEAMQHSCTAMKTVRTVHMHAEC